MPFLFGSTSTGFVSFLGEERLGLHVQPWTLGVHVVCRKP